MYLLQIIGCMSPPSTVGRHALSTRFTARVRVACLAHPDISSLQSVYTSIIEKVLPNTRSIGPAYLAKAMLEVYGQGPFLKACSKANTFFPIFPLWPVLYACSNA
eukprot:scaffold20343_cov20-Tisochrysis_lutea.AAC.1